MAMPADHFRETGIGIGEQQVILASVHIVERLATILGGTLRSGDEMAVERLNDGWTSGLAARGVACLAATRTAGALTDAADRVVRLG